jgi:hypothetical protein
LKIVLYAYSRGITSSRQIAQACEENIIFMALSADTHPHFTTIADFISRCDEEIVAVFRNVLLVADQLGLIGREMFAIDGCKLPSDASKEWSGTKEELKAKQAKLEKAIQHMLDKHRSEDAEPQSASQKDREAQQIETLRRHVEKLKNFLDEHEDKIGASGKPIKSNITDNESAKMKTSKGVIQGYVGVAAVDNQHQVVVETQAHGKAQEHQLLLPMIEGLQDNLEDLGNANPLQDSQITADAGFHTEANIRQLFEKDIDGYIADTRFRKRDPRFATADRHKPDKKSASTDRFTVADFIEDKATHTCLCPAGKKLYLKNRNAQIGKHWATCYQGAKRDCEGCHLRSRCLKDPNQKTTRQVCFFRDRIADAPQTYSRKMQRKIDSEEGRHIYSQRLGTVEPVFGHLHNIGLNRFSLRGKKKVDHQWRLYCLVHNMLKIHRYAT